MVVKRGGKHTQSSSIGRFNSNGANSGFLRRAPVELGWMLKRKKNEPQLDKFNTTWLEKERKEKSSQFECEADSPWLQL